VIARTRASLGVVRPGLLQMARALPPEPGVYRFRGDEGAVLYVGRAAQLRNRMTSCFSDLRDRRHLKPMVAAVANLRWLCESRHEAALAGAQCSRGRAAALEPYRRQETPVVIPSTNVGPVRGIRLRHLPHKSQEGVRSSILTSVGCRCAAWPGGAALANAGTRPTGSGQWQMSAASANATRTFSPRSWRRSWSATPNAVSQSRAELEDGGGALWQRRRSSLPAASTAS
jgi:hypothetical protein